MNKNNKNIYILGISCFYHDAAAALIKNGELIAAVQEERFSRIKHDDSFPKRAIEYCLKHAGINANELDYVGFYEKPILKFERLLETYIKTWPLGLKSFLTAMPIWFKHKLWIKSIIREKLNYNGKIYFIPHHLSHAASSFFLSKFSRSAILTLDGVGEWATTTYGIGQANKIKLIKQINFPHSLGLLWSALTYYLGFRVNSAEYKVMGLAPYGQDNFSKEFRRLVEIKKDGSFKLNMKYFSYEYGLKMTNKKFNKLFGGIPRIPESKLTQRHKDIAKSLQAITNEIIVKICNHIYNITKEDYLCLAGGVALNCVANSEILSKSNFKDVFIQPAAGDAGGSVGAAMYIYNSILNKTSRHFLKTIYLGPEYSRDYIKSLLKNKNIFFRELADSELFKKIAELINEQKIIGLFAGRMEFGPRALGNRSIIADARNKKNWQRVNLKIKFRESFRPFAPTVLEENLGEYFILDRPSPYMLLTAAVKKNIIPAVTHLDNSARIQSVSYKENPRYHSIIKEFYKLTECPVIINTSFNIRGEPIVCSPQDAIACFYKTEMDALIIENFLIIK